LPDGGVLSVAGDEEHWQVGAQVALGIGYLAPVMPPGSPTSVISSSSTCPGRSPGPCIAEALTLAGRNGERGGEDDVRGTITVDQGTAVARNHPFRDVQAQAQAVAIA
jgi:hypothetical protein